jgi:DNA-binding MarR family transcriptional regulator
MDYSVMADELLKKVTVLIRSHSHKKFGEFAEGEMFVLSHLTFVKDKALPSELSAVMNASTARIAAILNSLERKGWITRDADETDRRRIVVSLTASGKAFVLEKHRMIHDNMESLLRKLGDTDTRQVFRLIDRFIDIYSEMLPSGTEPCAARETKINQSDKGETAT